VLSPTHPTLRDASYRTDRKGVGALSKEPSLRDGSYRTATVRESVLSLTYPHHYATVRERSSTSSFSDSPPEFKSVPCSGPPR
jgi:hypothetical protein